MKSFLLNFWNKFGIGIVIVFFLAVLFKPLFFDNKTLLSANFLVGFYSPWSQEKFSEWPQGVPYKPIGIDDLRIFFPQRSFTKEMFSLSQIPFWNPYSFSGNYHLGLSETAVFYPLFFLSSFISQQDAWIILMLAEPVLAFLGMYLFLRLHFERKIYPFFGALVFGFSGIVLVR